MGTQWSLLGLQFALSIQTLTIPLFLGGCTLHPTASHKVMRHVPKEQPFKGICQSFISALRATLAAKASSHDGTHQLIIAFKPQLVPIYAYRLL